MLGANQNSSVYLFFLALLVSWCSKQSHCSEQMVYIASFLQTSLILCGLSKVVFILI